MNNRQTIWPAGKFRLLPAMILLFISAQNIQALDLFVAPYTAGENTIFFNTSIMTFSVINEEEGVEFNWNITIPRFKTSFDYVPPVSLPFFLGLYFDISKDSKYGVRGGYHINIDVDEIDLYLIYCFGLDFLQKEDEEIYLYDFRAGFRYMFGSLLGVYLESGLQMKELVVGLTLKLN
jgi:hypothetical protein